MAIKEFWGFDALPAYTGGSAALLFIRPDITNNGGGSYVKNAGGWLVGTGLYSSPTYYSPTFTVPYQNISDFTTRRSFFGFRHQVNQLGPGGGTPFLRLINTANTVQNIALTTQLVANLNQYIEVMFDRVNKLIVVWADGVQLSSTFFDFNSFVSADGNASLVFGTLTANGYVFIWQMRDFYFLDDTQDATQCNRLGPVDIRQSVPASISAPNWVSSDSGTPLSDLTTSLSVNIPTSLTLPTQTEPTSMDPITVGFGNANVVNGEKIVAFRGDITAQRTAGYVFNPATKLTLGAASVNTKTPNFPVGNTMVFNQNLFLQETAPDGSVWTPASIQNTALIIAP